jgi:hypothetical protein
MLVSGRILFISMNQTSPMNFKIDTSPEREAEMDTFDKDVSSNVDLQATT